MTKSHCVSVLYILYVYIYEDLKLRMTDQQVSIYEKTLPLPCHVYISMDFNFEYLILLNTVSCTNDLFCVCVVNADMLLTRQLGPFCLYDYSLVLP